MFDLGLKEFLYCTRFFLGSTFRSAAIVLQSALFIGHLRYVIILYLPLFASAAKWGDWQRIPGLWEHLQRMWDLHRWRHGGSCTPRDAWRCGDRQWNRGHTAWPWRWRNQVSPSSTGCTKLCHGGFIFDFFKKACFYVIVHNEALLLLKIPVVLAQIFNLEVNVEH